MRNIEKALDTLASQIKDWERQTPISYEEFLDVLFAAPHRVIRNVFQVFHDMVKTYVGDGVDEYPDDPESINFVYYDCSRLFISETGHPFFADRLFANRLINLAASLRSAAQQNKVYIFEGPPGCGKSTFLNNLLHRFETYANSPEGMRYEVLWRLNRKLIGDSLSVESMPVLATLFQQTREKSDTLSSIYTPDDTIEVPCPSHDNPILMIPKNHRRAFFDDLYKNNKFKWKLFTEKEYEWVFKDDPCTICSSIYRALLYKLKSPQKVFQMMFARPYLFNRRQGEGISVYNPGDAPMKRNVLTNDILQEGINQILMDSNQVKYIYSLYAKTNNGIYALMDIKSHNTQRLIELHNIISEGVHKVDEVEENVDSLFLALMNPEDKKHVHNIQSFSDRIEYINLPYVLDINTEIAIYRSIFGKHIDNAFLPRIIQNFARIIISTRLNLYSEAMTSWIPDPSQYQKYCDMNLQLLKMEIYTGHIPAWLSEDDRKSFTAKRRRKIINESESEGKKGLSGRDSIKIFNELYTAYSKNDRLINMNDLIHFFSKLHPEYSDEIPDGFLESLVKLYNFTILQEVKESLYYFNENQIDRDVKNYIYCVNFEFGTTETCQFTGDTIDITESFFESIEIRLLGTKIDKNTRHRFRWDVQKEYTSKTLTQDMLIHDLKIDETELFQSLKERYVYNLKEKVLEPFLANENFRNAIRDYSKEKFKTYDKRIREDVKFLINNLEKKYQYSEQGAQQVCIYVIDNHLTEQFQIE